MKFIKYHFPIYFFLVITFFWACQQEKATSTDMLFNSAFEKAEELDSKAQVDSAFFYYNQAKWNTKDKNSDTFAYILLKSAMIQHHLGDYTGCEETITEALSYYNQKTYLAYLYNLLASTYYRLKNYPDALLYYQKAVKASTNETDKIIYQNNIGLIYLETEKYAQSITLLNTLFHQENIKTNSLELARIQDNLGYAQFKLNLPNAFVNLSQAWQVRDSLDDNLGKIASNIHLAEYYQHKDQIKTNYFADLAYLASKKAQSPDDQLEALKWLSKQSNPLEAKQYFEQYIHLNDSLNNARSKAKNQFAKIKYDAKKATQEVVKYKNQKSILIVIIGLIIIIVFLLYRLFQNKNKRKLQQATYKTETRISKRIHDELANDVFNVMTFTQTQNLENPSSKEALLDNLEHIYERTRDISKENSDIRTDENFEPDLWQLIDGYGNSKLNVIRKINEPINWQKITPEKKITLQRVIQEFLVNTKKHSQATLVVIAFSEDKKNITVTYSDNGIGIKDTQKRKSGLQNAETRILAIQGSFTFDPTIQNGCKVTVVIPK